ncbi:MAG TPA: hypothetical protein VLE53_10450 [Gemmatimonadaceae bacterium]|nr:hypothetical protein [Gemmatimonadaceae bacterium]
MMLRLLVLMLLTGLACSGRQPGDDRSDSAVPSRPIDQVLAEHTPSLMRIPGVTGTAQSLCAGEPCIQVFVIDTTPELRRRIPDRIEGYPVQLQATGVIRPRRDTT